MVSQEMSTEEREVLQTLDALIRNESIAAMIDPIVLQVEKKLAQSPDALMAWEPIPVSVYGKDLPAMIRSSWVFILRAQVTTGAERHPNSHQRMVSYREQGNFQVWSEGRWRSHFLMSDLEADLESRWVSIPPNVWHQAADPAQDWVVVSFHTALADELIEERPDTNDLQSTQQRTYLEGPDQ